MLLLRVCSLRTSEGQSDVLHSAPLRTAAEYSSPLRMAAEYSAPLRTAAVCLLMSAMVHEVFR